MGYIPPYPPPPGRCGIKDLACVHGVNLCGHGGYRQNPAGVRFRFSKSDGGSPPVFRNRSTSRVWGKRGIFVKRFICSVWVGGSGFSNLNRLPSAGTYFSNSSAGRQRPALLIARRPLVGLSYSSFLNETLNVHMDISECARR